MSKCIMKTLTPAARVRLLPFQGDYEIEDVIYAPLLHKKIMGLATIDSVLALQSEGATYLLFNHQGRHRTPPLLLRRQLYPDH
jgi:hypothetical protein